MFVLALGGGQARARGAGRKVTAPRGAGSCPRRGGGAKGGGDCREPRSGRAPGSRVRIAQRTALAPNGSPATTRCWTNGAQPPCRSSPGWAGTAQSGTASATSTTWAPGSGRHSCRRHSCRAPSGRETGLEQPPPGRARGGPEVCVPPRPAPWLAPRRRLAAGLQRPHGVRLRGLRLAALDGVHRRRRHPGRQAGQAHPARRADHVGCGAQELDGLGGYRSLHPRSPRLAAQALRHPRILHRRGLRVLPQGPGREPVPRPPARQPAGGVCGRPGRTGDRRHPLLRGPRRLGRRVPDPGHVLGRHAPHQPGAGGPGAGDAGAARRAPGRHRHRAADRRQRSFGPGRGST